MKKQLVTLLLAVVMLLSMCVAVAEPAAVPEDGCYHVAVESDSSMFKVVNCVLTAKDGAYTATITMSGTGYDKVFLGTAEEAAAAAEHIAYVADDEGAYTFTFPVEKLDAPIAVAAHSAKKDTWYDRNLTFKSEGMVKALDNGQYTVAVESDSGMFKVVNCVLTAKNGAYTATITMSGTGYDKVFLGTAEEAAAAAEHIAYVADDEGAYTFTFPVEKLDAPIAVAAHSAKKDTWYDRNLTFKIDSIEQIPVQTQDSEADKASLSDGVFIPDEFILTGGTGRVTITCEQVEIRDGQAYATILFSSPNYTCVRVGDVKYDSVCDKKTSRVEIPVVLNQAMTMYGTTTAMSAAHEVEYSIFIRVDALKREGAALEIPGLVWVSSMKPQYAEQFSVEYYEGGYALIDVKDSARYLVVPENMFAPEGLDPAIVVLQQPLDTIYLAATSAMALFDSIDSIDAIRLVGTQKDGWYIDNAVAAMENGTMRFAGKYSEPDFEMLLTQDCNLAIESMMISHAPKVKEMLELLGIPVFIDCSSRESHPLGRTEWIKLYAVMMDKEAEAEAFFNEQAKIVEKLKGFENTGKTIAFFYLHTDGSAVVRSTADYVPGMIEIAGGKYVFEELLDPESDRSSISISMEEFYNAAVAADYLIYNATIDDPIASVDELLAKSSLFADFKAVQEGNVWSTGKYLYQATDVVGGLITDINLMLQGETEGMTFITKLD